MSAPILKRLALAAAIFGACGLAQAQDLLIRNATVHTASARGTLRNTDVLVKQGRIAAIGSGLATGSAKVVDAQGQPLTPSLFGGITDIGVEEVSGESSTVDATLALGANAADMQVRPEFDVTLAYNPDSVLVPVARVEGVGWTLLAAGTRPGGSLIGGQGGVVRLDGSLDAVGPRALFVTLGGAGANLSGSSRAAQWMLLDQLIDEVRGRIPADSQFALLTPAGRSTLAKYFGGGGRVLARVQRAADIVRLLRWAKQRGVRVALVGAAEGWKVAPQIAAAGVPVFVDVLANLPGDFDEIGATLENAGRLHAAGVKVSFFQGGDASHNARKLRQLAGNAVANGLPWEAGLAGLTSVPAAALGAGADIGATIAVGQRADLVLWSGDPLDVASVARQLWLDGRAIPMRSRQTELRDRYLRAAGTPQEGQLPRAYPADAR
ncbi:amidohydrolase [Thermomonas fusca]|uniref:Amidohydrolase n=1 Tax=Thermomonas fusca TaxID=215690 RepID=A0A5R9PD33_9GAMM|nr:amidohydrolase [Thermomonas fusca]TLX21126.1 amidohydrolase [Thermomonas fusca]